MKNYYFATMDIYPDKTQCSYVLQVPENVNLYAALDRNDTKIVQFAKSKKDAEKLASYWNECSYKNGKYPFTKIYPVVTIKAY